MFMKYMCINICDILRKITLLNIQSIMNIIKLTPSFISNIKSVNTDNTIKNNILKNNKKVNKHKINTNYNKNKILNKCICEYNINQECDWGWFVEIDEIDEIYVK